MNDTLPNDDPRMLAVFVLCARPKRTRLRGRLVSGVMLSSFLPSRPRGRRPPRWRRGGAEAVPPLRGTVVPPRTVSRLSSVRGSGEHAVDFASHGALQAAHHPAFGQGPPSYGASASMSRDVGPGSGVGAHAADGDRVQGGVGPAVSAVVEGVALDLSTRCWDWTGAAHHREARRGAQLIGIPARGDDQFFRAGWCPSPRVRAAPGRSRRRGDG